MVCILSTSIMTSECWGRKGMVGITGQRLLLGGLGSGREGKVYARVWRLLERSVFGRCCVRRVGRTGVVRMWKKPD
jgi:hypothetical protein